MLFGFFILFFCPICRCAWHASGVKAVEWLLERAGTWPGTTRKTCVLTAPFFTIKVGFVDMKSHVVSRCCWHYCMVLFYLRQLLYHLPQVLWRQHATHRDDSVFSLQPLDSLLMWRNFWSVCFVFFKYIFVDVISNWVCSQIHLRWKFFLLFF